MQSFLSLLEHFFKVSFTKYKIATLNKFLILPLLLFLGHYFQGEFVKTVDYFGRLVPYLYFILIAKAAAIHFYDGIYSITDIFTKRTGFLYTLVIYDKYKVFISYLISDLIQDILYYFIAFMPLFIFFKISPLSYIILVILSLILIIPGLAFGFLFASIILPKRSEGRTITNLLEHFLYTLIPITFASYVLPKPEILTMILPNIGGVEEIRKIILLGEFDLNKILMLLIISIAYLIVSVLIFEKRFEEARRKGWLKLV